MPKGLVIGGLRTLPFDALEVGPLPLPYALSRRIRTALGKLAEFYLPRNRKTPWFPKAAVVPQAVRDIRVEAVQPVPECEQVHLAG